MDIITNPEIWKMFTGIIESLGLIKEVIKNGSNATFWISSNLTQELKVNQSVSHNGVCLTVEEIKGSNYRITAIEETLLKTNLGTLAPGDTINLERCMVLNGRLDGHIVQGHVDCTAECIEIIQKEGSHEFTFSFSEQFASLIIEKGSVTVNGISLTCFNVKKAEFTVAIIPYTFEHTNIKTIKTGDFVNIEWDIIGKYIARKLSL